MIELYKSAIEHLGWPIFVLVVFFSLRKPLLAILDQVIDLLKRANLLSFKHKETVLEARAEIVSQTIEASNDRTEVLLGAGAALTIQKSDEANALSTDKDSEREAIRDYGKNVPSVQLQEAAIAAALERAGFTLNTADTTSVLIRQLAAQQCVSTFERVYRLIFGSQIRMLEFLNVRTHDEDTLRAFYEAISATNPEFYSEYDFERWFGFLLHPGLVRRVEDSNSYETTSLAKDFLVWMVNQGLSKEKPF